MLMLVYLGWSAVLLAAPLRFPGQISVATHEPTTSVVGYDVDDDNWVELMVGHESGLIKLVEHVAYGQFYPTRSFDLGSKIVDLKTVEGPTGEPDILVALTANPDQVVLLQYQVSPELFSVLAAVELDEDPADVVYGPFGPDEAPALAVTTPGSDCWVLVADSGDGWQIEQVVPSGDGPVAIVPLDMDGDGQLELVTADNGVLSRSCSVFARDLSGTYSLVNQIDMDGAPFKMQVFDQDDDLQDELFVSYSDSCHVTVFTPQSGNLVEIDELQIFTPGDGLLVHSILEFEKGLWCWSTERGTVHFFRRAGAAWNLHETYYCGGQAVDVTITNMNGDLWPDLAVANGASDEVALLFGNNAINFRAFLATLLPPSPTGGIIFDEDLDGDLDYLVACFGTATVEILRCDNQGHLVMDPEPVQLANPPRTLNTIHADADNLLDLAIVQPSVPRIQIMRRLPGGGYTPLGVMPTGVGPYKVLADDLNDDGIDDLVVGNEGSDNITVGFGVGDGTFVDVSELHLVDAPDDIVLADIDDNDLPDIIFTSCIGRVTTLTNLGGIFGQARFYNYPGCPRVIARADFDDDGDFDIVVAQANSNALTFIENLSDGSLMERLRDFELGKSPTSLSVGDFTENGFPDLAITYAEEQVISIVVNSGDWFMIPPVDFQSALEPYATAVGDFNNDNILDLVVLDRSLELALTMLNIEPNPVPTAPRKFVARCRAGIFELSFQPPLGDAWWLEGAANSDWVRLAESATAFHGDLSRAVVGWQLTLSAGAVAAAGLTEGNDGLYSFRLVTPGAADSPVTTAQTARCWSDGETPPGRYTHVEAPYPNPFNPAVFVRFELPRATWVEGVVCDLSGRRVASLGRSWYPAGANQVTWDGLTDSGAAATGTYVLSLAVDGRRFSYKVTLLK
ncbi:MAG: VCBS repeat-containing protein [bacterium]